MTCWVQCVWMPPRTPLPSTSAPNHSSHPPLHVLRAPCRTSPWRAERGRDKVSPLGASLPWYGVPPTPVPCWSPWSQPGLWGHQAKGKEGVDLVSVWGLCPLQGSLLSQGKPRASRAHTAYILNQSIRKAVCDWARPLSPALSFWGGSLSQGSNSGTRTVLSGFFDTKNNFKARDNKGRV